MRRGRLGNALCWAVKSQDTTFTSFLADKFLEDYIKNGKLASKDLLDNLGSCMLVSDRLIFLGKVLHDRAKKVCDIYNKTIFRQIF